MEVIESPLVEEGKMGIVEQTPEQTLRQPQPAFQPSLPLDEATVRAAVQQAEASGDDPTQLRIRDVAQVETPQQPSKAAQAEPPVDVPEKFRKPNGEVDVDKLNASTKQLDVAIEQKQEKLQDVNKFVEEQLRSYKEKERQLRSLPNPNRIAAQVNPVPPPPMQSAAEMSNEQIEAMLNQDLRANPARTIASLVQSAIQSALQPLDEEKRDNRVRENLKQLASEDSRVVSHIATINTFLDEHPEYRQLPNPHKAAWLEVREALRLGGPMQAQAQPSKPVAPVLGGGTPPPAPSSSTGQPDVQTVLAASKQIGADPRGSKYDPKQWDKLDAVARQVFK